MTQTTACTISIDGNLRWHCMVSAAVAQFYGAKHSGVRYCHDKLSVCLSVTLVVCDYTRWNLEFFQKNFTDD